MMIKHNVICHMIVCVSVSPELQDTPEELWRTPEELLGTPVSGVEWRWMEDRKAYGSSEESIME